MDKKKFLMVSYYGDSTDIARKIHNKGHEVRFCIDDPEEKGTGELGYGFFEHVADWKDHIDWADVIIFDNCGYGKIAEELRSKGKLVIGGSIYTDKLEEDRDFGQAELERFGIPIIQSKEFKDFDEAIDYVKHNPARYVMKPSGDKTVQHIGLLFVGEEEDGRDVIQLLTEYKKAWGSKIPAIQLQKKVTGIEVGVGSFFNGKNFTYPLNIGFEHKRMFPGDIGPLTGEMGSSMFWSEPNMFFNATIKKMESRLAESGYVGYFDLNCIVDEHNIYPLEFTCRFGYPTISIQQEGILEDIDEFLWGLVTKQFTHFNTKKGPQIGVCLFVPPYPFNDPQLFKVKYRDSIIYFRDTCGKTINNHTANDHIANNHTYPNNLGDTHGHDTNKLNNTLMLNNALDTLDWVHIVEVKKFNGDWLVSGTEGWVMIVCGSGLTMEDAQKQAYQRVRQIVMPNMYYRIDIGGKWNDEIPLLKKWGYI